MHIARLKGASLQSLHTVRFQLCDIWKRHNYGHSKKVQDCQDSEKGGCTGGAQGMDV